MTLVAGDGGGADDYTYVVPSGGTFNAAGFEASCEWRAFWASVDGQARVTEWK